MVDYYDKYYSNGYYRYFVLLTFKDGTAYADKHPRDGWAQFQKDITKYFKKHGMVYEFYPELSVNGRLHCHGFVCFKANEHARPETQYEIHEKELRLIKNYIRRKYGLNTFNRSYSYKMEYSVVDVRRRLTNREYKSTFEEGYKYMIKEVDKYGFLKVFRNVVIK